MALLIMLSAVEFCANTADSATRSCAYHRVMFYPLYPALLRPEGRISLHLRALWSICINPLSSFRSPARSICRESVSLYERLFDGTFFHVHPPKVMHVLVKIPLTACLLSYRVVRFVYVCVYVCVLFNHISYFIYFSHEYYTSITGNLWMSIR